MPVFKMFEVEFYKWGNGILKQRVKKIPVITKINIVIRFSFQKILMIKAKANIFVIIGFGEGYITIGTGITNTSSTGISVVKQWTSQCLKFVIEWVTVSESALSIGPDS